MKGKMVSQEMDPSSPVTTEFNYLMTSSGFYILLLLSVKSGASNPYL